METLQGVEKGQAGFNRMEVIYPLHDGVCVCLGVCVSGGVYISGLEN